MKFGEFTALIGNHGLLAELTDEQKKHAAFEYQQLSPKAKNSLIDSCNSRINITACIGKKNKHKKTNKIIIVIDRIIELLNVLENSKDIPKEESKKNFFNKKPEDVKKEMKANGLVLRKRQKDIEDSANPNPNSPILNVKFKK